MRFLIGVLLGYSMRGKKKPLIAVLTTIAFVVYLVVPTIALLALHLDAQNERRRRPAQISIPALKGLSYQDAETKLRASNLNIRLLATRCDLPLQPGLVMDQTPQPGEKVDRGYPIGVTVTKECSMGDSQDGFSPFTDRSPQSLRRRASSPARKRLRSLTMKVCK